MHYTHWHCDGYLYSGVMCGERCTKPYHLRATILPKTPPHTHRHSHSCTCPLHSPRHLAAAPTDQKDLVHTGVNTLELSIRMHTRTEWSPTSMPHTVTSGSWECPFERPEESTQNTGEEGTCTVGALLPHLTNVVGAIWEV